MWVTYYETFNKYLSMIVIRPGGKFTLTDEELQNYKCKDRNACTCSNDQQWYTAALKHILSPVKYFKIFYL